MLSSFVFTASRILQILLLLPMVGMLGYFVDPYVKGNTTPPDWLLLTFIISILGAVWCLLTLFQFHRSSITSALIIFVDIAFMACFIAAVVLMRFVQKWDCVSASVPVGIQLGNNNYSGGSNWSLQVKKTCTMLKVTWAFAIINIILFALTALFAFQLHRRNYDHASAPVKERRHRSRRRRHY